MAIASVASGEVVGNCIVFKSAGPVPTPQTNFVPPASIEPNMLDMSPKESATEPRRGQNRLV